jgi:hypothetical protein
MATNLFYFGNFISYNFSKHKYLFKKFIIAIHVMAALYIHHNNSRRLSVLDIVCSPGDYSCAVFDKQDEQTEASKYNIIMVVFSIFMFTLGARLVTYICKFIYWCRY